MNYNNNYNNIQNNINLNNNYVNNNLSNNYKYRLLNNNINIIYKNNLWNSNLNNILPYKPQVFVCKDSKCHSNHNDFNELKDKKVGTYNEHIE